MSTFEPTVIITILQNAEKMAPKEAKEFRAAWEEKVCNFFAILKTCGCLTVRTAGAEVV
jgi:hypothetical protein